MVQMANRHSLTKEPSVKSVRAFCIWLSFVNVYKSTPRTPERAREAAFRAPSRYRNCSGAQSGGCSRPEMANIGSRRLLT